MNIAMGRHLRPHRWGFRSCRQVGTVCSDLLDIVVVDPEVKEAIANNKPVVALESTIISHGLPFPRNLEVARMLESIVREHGGVPATTAIIDGVPRVGLSNEEIENLASNKGNQNILKASHRDLSYVCAKRLNAGILAPSNSTSQGLSLSRCLYFLFCFVFSNNCCKHHDTGKFSWNSSFCYRRNWW